MRNTSNSMSAGAVKSQAIKVSFHRRVLRPPVAEVAVVMIDTTMKWRWGAPDTALPSL